MYSRPVIQETAVIAHRPSGGNPIGEALPSENVSTKPMSAEQRASTVSRLEKTITSLMNRASKTYSANCFRPGTSQIDPDYISRLSTNEFFFYTQEPLTLEEFEKLQNKIAEEAKKHPSGVHLVLGSFAVKTADNQVMNVVPHIACGQPPQFQFIVKNHTSPIDPIYNIPDGSGNTTTLEPLDILSHNPDKPLADIQIGGVKQHFTFNNIVHCKTPGGKPFLTAVDICLDHFKGVAKKNLAKLTGINNMPIAPMVISNHIGLFQSQCCAGNPMHVDPVHSSTQCTKNAAQSTTYNLEMMEFGADPVSFYNVDKYPLSTMQQEFAPAKARFISILQSLGIKISNLNPMHLEFHPSQKQEFELLKKKLDEYQVPYRQTTPTSFLISDNVLASGALMAMGTELAQNRLNPRVDYLKTQIPSINNTNLVLNFNQYSPRVFEQIQLLFHDRAEAHAFLKTLQQVNPGFYATIENVPSGCVISCGLELLTNNTFIINVITTHNRATLAASLTATPHIKLDSQSPFSMHFTTELTYLSIKKYLDDNHIPYSQKAPLDLVIADAFFGNSIQVMQMRDILNSPHKMHALTEALQQEGKIQDILPKLTTEYAKLKQQYDTLAALKDKPSGTDTLLRIMSNTLQTTASTIIAFQNYLDNPGSPSIASHLPTANQILDHTVPNITTQLQGLKEKLLHRNLNEVDDYYSKKQKFSLFKVQYKQVQGSAAKTAILEEFKTILMNIGTAEDIQKFKDSLKDPQHKNGANFKILTKAQNFSADETNSVKALNQMIHDRENDVSQANSLKF